MKRLLVPAIPAVGSNFSPPEDERRHLQDVRRVKNGEVLEVLDGQGGLATARVSSMTKNRMSLEVLEVRSDLRDSPLQLEVAVAIPTQKSTFDETLPGLVQLGADTIFLVATDYGGRLKPDNGKYETRLHTIATQSLKQCGRLRAPRLVICSSFAELVAGMATRNQANILFHPVETQVPLPQKLSSLGLLIGPEGGFSPAEVELATNAACIVRGLGSRILRLETAAIGACFWAQSLYGDL